MTRPIFDLDGTLVDAGIGLLSGGYGEDELTRAGAFRVDRDAAELHGGVAELGIEA